MQDLELTGTAICSNGAMIYDLTNREVTHAQTVPLDVVRKVSEALAEVIPNVGIAVETGFEVLSEPGFQGFGPKNPYRTLELLDHVFAEAQQVVQMLAWAPDAEVDHDMMEIAREAVGQHVSVTHSGRARPAGDQPARRLEGRHARIPVQHKGNRQARGHRVRRDAPDRPAPGRLALRTRWATRTRS